MELNKNDTLYLTDKGIELCEKMGDPPPEISITSISAVKIELIETLGRQAKDLHLVVQAVLVVDDLEEPTIRNIERKLLIQGMTKNFIEDVLRGVEIGFEKEYITTKY